MTSERWSLLSVFVLGIILSMGMREAAFASDMRQFTDDAGRTIEVPVKPQRIVSMHDVDITIPLLELGIMPVASHGHVSLDGKKFLRSSELLTGVEFDNAPIAFIGSTAPDIEAIISAKPDLIITEPSRSTMLDQLQKIAPTVVINNLLGGAPRIYGRLADLTGTQDRFTLLERRYRAEIESIKRVVDTSKITVSVLQANKGKLTVHHTYRALGRVLRDAGFRFPEIIESIPEGERIDVSIERLPDLDADFIFDAYRSDTGGTPADEIEEMQKLLPGYCDFLKACREGRYILLPRDEAISNSYMALSLMAGAVQSNIAGRPLSKH